jgi:hypothetical protein
MLLLFLSFLRPPSDSAVLLALNQRIDSLVVARDTTSLRGLYAPDFVFNHGSGRTEGITTWLVSASRGSFTERRHDSVRVELHPGGLAILRGRLNVTKKNKEKEDRYYLWYIRVFTRTKKQWRLRSHTTYYEAHL